MDMTLGQESGTMNAAIGALRAMYQERHNELGRIIDTRAAMGDGAGNLTDDGRRIWEKRGEQIEYLFGCLDGLANAIHQLDPSPWSSGWRDFSTWEASLAEAELGVER